jgi:hypothetical protein
MMGFVQTVREIVDRLLSNTKFLVVGGYVLFMVVFYFIGITSARFLDFVAVAVLTGFYALLVLWVKKIREGLAMLFPVSSVPHAIQNNMLSEVSVTTSQPTLIVKKEILPLELSQNDFRGRIAIAYSEGLLPKNKAFTKNQLHGILESRFSKREAYANFDDALADFVFWGYFEKVQSGKRWDYRVKLDPEEARTKGLLKNVEN